MANTRQKRQPAAFEAKVALDPSRRLVSREPVWNLARMVRQGQQAGS
jgi:Asp-tRNA(Asn)/Glu-tRNA(Gln) amidotransferase A subunit family amidase